MAVMEKFRSMLTRVYQPLVAKYLSVTRHYSYQNIHLTIPPGVFHPGFFSSTRLLLNAVDKLELNEKSFLELGAGSGLISFCAAKRKALVTATDINPLAAEYLRKNAAANSCELTIIESDLFENIPVQQFDIIAVNPPYYKKNPASYSERAWYCGENGEYFQYLFSTMDSYIHEDSVILMVLGEQCDLQMIRSIAAGNQYKLNMIMGKRNLFGRHMIYKIEHNNPQNRLCHQISF